MSTVTISMPDTLKEYVEEQVRTKGFGNVSEYFRSLVREAQKREAQERLEKLLLEGLASPAIEATPEFWDELKAEASARIEAARKKSQKRP